MKKTYGKYYFLLAALLIYFGTKHLNSFNVFYDGTALVFGVGSLVFGIMNYINDKKN